MYNINIYYKISIYLYLYINIYIYIRCSANGQCNCKEGFIGEACDKVCFKKLKNILFIIILLRSNVWICAIIMDNVLKDNATVLKVFI